eukprot:3494961-Rhodomonas_salina.2
MYRVSAHDATTPCAPAHQFPWSELPLIAPSIQESVPPAIDNLGDLEHSSTSTQPPVSRLAHPGSHAHAKGTEERSESESESERAELEAAKERRTENGNAIRRRMLPSSPFANEKPQRWGLVGMCGIQACPRRGSYM